MTFKHQLLFWSDVLLLALLVPFMICVVLLALACKEILRWFRTQFLDEP